MPRRAKQPPVEVRYEASNGVWLQVNPEAGLHGGAVVDVATAHTQRVTLFVAVTLDPTASHAKVELPPEAARAVRDALTRAIVHQDPTPRDRAILSVQEALDA